MKQGTKTFLTFIALPLTIAVISIFTVFIMMPRLEELPKESEKVIEVKKGDTIKERTIIKVVDVKDKENKFAEEYYAQRSYVLDFWLTCLGIIITVISIILPIGAYLFKRDIDIKNKEELDFAKKELEDAKKDVISVKEELEIAKKEVVSSKNKIEKTKEECDDYLLKIKEEEDSLDKLIKEMKVELNTLSDLRNEVKIDFEYIKKENKESIDNLKKNKAISYFIEALKFQDEKDYTKSIESYNKSLKLNPKDHLSYNNLGCIYLEIKDYANSELFLKKSIEENSDFGGAYSNLSILYLEKKEFEKSIEYAKKALKLEPDNISNNYNIIEVYLLKGDYLEALEYLNKYIEKFKDRAVILIKDYYIWENSIMNCNIKEVKVKLKELFSNLEKKEILQ
ncbi:MAG: tetratricopeptide repeat protein [Alphaproteobacteria bacterium]|jgi:tetratricopeptide (TPR) repeat protein|nr:tetratricopeptide repeat protein [Alphaproteobacteria bacterium]